MAWKIRYYREADGTEPVRAFFGGSDILPSERKRFETRLTYIAEQGLSILGRRSDVLETLVGAPGIYALRLPRSPNNPRVLLCTMVGETFVLLHAFKESRSSDYAAAIQIAQTRRDHLTRAAKSAQPHPRRGRR